MMMRILLSIAFNITVVIVFNLLPGLAQASQYTTIIDPFSGALKAFINKKGQVLVECAPSDEKLASSSSPQISSSATIRFVRLELPYPARQISNQSILLENGSVWTLLPPSGHDHLVIDTELDEASFCGARPGLSYRLVETMKKDVIKIASNHGFVLALLSDGSVVGWGNGRIRGLGTPLRQHIQVRSYGPPTGHGPSREGVPLVIWSDYQGFSIQGANCVEECDYLSMNVFDKNPDPIFPLFDYKTGKTSTDKNNDIIDISVSRTHYMALTSGGTIYTWGFDQTGQFGNVDWITQGPVFGFFKVKHKLVHLKRIVAGFRYSYAIDANGRIYYWGSAHDEPSEQDPLGKNISYPNAIVSSEKPLHLSDTVNPISFDIDIASDELIFGLLAEGKDHEILYIPSENIINKIQEQFSILQQNSTKEYIKGCAGAFLQRLNNNNNLENTHTFCVSYSDELFLNEIDNKKTPPEIKMNLIKNFHIMNK